MNDLYLRCLKALWRRAFYVVLIACLAGGAAVLKELLLPPGYSAEKLLVVTDINASGTTAELVPGAFNPKIYEQLVLSSSVLGEVLEELKTQKAFGENDPPALRDFRSMLEVEISLVDETTRPINYSPLIRLSVVAETAALAGAIVEAWSDKVMATASDAVTLRMTAETETLAKQTADQRTQLEEIWKAMEEENALWNLERLKQEMSTRIGLATEFYKEKTGIERSLQDAEEKLRMTREDLAQELEMERGAYKQEWDTLRDKLAQETAQWNLDVIGSEMDVQLELMNSLEKKRVDIERELMAVAKELESTQAVLESETPYLELAKAPSETAYWIVKGEDATSKSLADLEGKVMVSQELNGVYWEAKKDEKALLKQQAGLEAQLESIKTQWAEATEKQQALEVTLSEHKAVQDQLDMEMHVSQQRYIKLATTKQLELKDEERSLLMSIASQNANLAIVAQQLDTVEKEREEYEALIAQHTTTQRRLQVQENIISALFDDLAKSNSFTAAAAMLASETAGDGIRAVGLNRLSKRTFAVVDNGLLGRKGRVLLTTILALFFTISLVLLCDVLVPVLHALIHDTKKAIL